MENRIRFLVAATALASAATALGTQAAEHITVEGQRLGENQRIKADVMDKLASDTRLSGKIGVESHHRVVKLTGYTTDAVQADRAELDARGVDGVRDVDNEIMPRVGGSR